MPPYKGYKSNHGKKKYQVVQPFQLFCLQNRVQTAMMHPNLKGTGVTSILAKKWRSLDQKSRDYFEQLSMSIRQQNILKIYHEKVKHGEEHEKYVEFYLPNIFLEPRNNFAQIAVEISQKTSGVH